MPARCDAAREVDRGQLGVEAVLRLGAAGCPTRSRRRRSSSSATKTLATSVRRASARAPQRRRSPRRSCRRGTRRGSSRGRSCATRRRAPARSRGASAAAAGRMTMAAHRGRASRRRDARRTIAATFSTVKPKCLNSTPAGRRLAEACRCRRTARARIVGGADVLAPAVGDAGLDRDARHAGRQHASRARRRPARSKTLRAGHRHDAHARCLRRRAASRARQRQGDLGAGGDDDRAPVAPPRPSRPARSRRGGSRRSAPRRAARTARSAA